MGFWNFEAVHLDGDNLVPQDGTVSAMILDQLYYLGGQLQPKQMETAQAIQMSVRSAIPWKLVLPVPTQVPR